MGTLQKLVYIVAESLDLVTSVRRVTSEKLDPNATRETLVVFNLNVKMDEAERKDDFVKLNFEIMLDSDPAIVNFIVDGSTTLRGDAHTIEKMLSPDPQTQVPQVFTRIYQQVYSVVFLLAGTLNVPYPSPALLKRIHVQTAIPDQIQR